MRSVRLQCLVHMCTTPVRMYIICSEGGGCVCQSASCLGGELGGF
jgi:hypothetical protein